MKLTTLALTFTAALGLLFTHPLRAVDEPVLMQPVKSILDQYLAIQGDLANDSIIGLDEHANAIAKAVTGDEMKMLAVSVAKQAELLAKAKDLRTARQAFVPLSNSLIKYLADHKAGAGTYHVVYCSMVNAYWLQTAKDIKNPYMGKQMLTCGQFKS